MGRCPPADISLKLPVRRSTFDDTAEIKPDFRHHAWVVQASPNSVLDNFVEASRMTWRFWIAVSRETRCIGP